MMFFLIFNVRFHGSHIGFADAEGSVSGLPGEFGMMFITEPFAGIGFDGSDKIGNMHFFGEKAKDMDVVIAAIYDDGSPIDVFDNTGDILVHFIMFEPGEEFVTIFGGKDNMGGKVAIRGWHSSLHWVLFL
jgi:hypothetical protein